MSDATLDSNAGGSFENTANKWTGDLNDEEASNWYGWLSLIMGYGCPFVFMFLNEKQYVAMNVKWFMYHIEFYLPVGMAWILLRYFPGDFMTEVYKDVMALSILAPWLFLWVGLYEYFLAGDGNYDELFFWVYFAGYGLWTIFEGVIQIAVLPKAFDHLNHDYSNTADNATWVGVLSAF